MAAITSPLMLVGAIWMWRGVAWGRLITGALLAMGVVEGIGVAVDSGWGVPPTRRPRSRRPR